MIVGDDHTFGKGTVQSYINQPGRLGALKVTTQLFFRPGGASTQHAGVAADVVLPSIFASDDLGERYTPYSLGAQSIEPFLETPIRVSRFSTRERQPKPWGTVTEEVVTELQNRSAARIAESEDFIEIREQLAKFEAQDDVVHLAELIREREEAEGKDEGSAEGASDADDATPDAQPKDAAAEPESDGAAADPDAHTGDAGDEEEEEPTPQQAEALRILADLVEIQDGRPSAWTASRTAPDAARHPNGYPRSSAN